MKAPLIWLKDFTGINVSPKELADRMTMSGSKVEEIITTGSDITGVYTGRITKITDHPDSDHLRIVNVDLGSDELGRDIQIVCGAPNIYEGMICPVAKPGARLPEMEIKKTKMRGVQSYGMCCSIDELGVSPEGYPGADEYGLWNMPQDTPVGVDIREVLGYGSTTFDFEITSNRPDCFSIEGLAREAAVTLGIPFRPLSPVVKEEGKFTASDIISVDIEDPGLCSRYCARTIEDVVIAPSPEWMADRLTQAGVTPVNNIEDITNYVCIELGCQMHAYDLDHLAGNRITVRTAKERCGCSEVIQGTKTVLLESVVFSSQEMRTTAPETAVRALDRACELVGLIGCGKVSKGVIDIYPAPVTPRRIGFDPGWIDSFLGIDASADYMKKILTDLGCSFEGNDIIPPSFRPDLQSRADIAGEVARFYGYNNIKPTLLSGKQTTPGGRTPSGKTAEKIRDTLVACGFCEALTYTFESPSDLDLIDIPSDSPLRDQVRIANPIGDDTSVMRTTMLPSMIRIASRNSSRGVAQARVFELAYVCLPGHDPSALPEEKHTLAGFSYSNVSSVNGADLFYETRGAIEELAQVLGIGSIFFEAMTDHPTFHPGRTAGVTVNGKHAGVIGIIHPDVAEKCDCPPKACFFELDAEIFIDAARTARRYKQIPRYPGIARDLSVIVPRKTAVGDIIHACRSAGGKYLREVEFFDVYEDDGIGEDNKSVAVSLTFRADDRTLTDGDVSDAFNKIVAKLGKQFGGKLRE